MAVRKIYNQGQLNCSFNGVSLSGLMSGASVTIHTIGGEVEVTEGTDGGASNIATLQGGRITVIFRETSDSVDFLNTQVSLQQVSGTPGVFILNSGVKRLYTIANALVSVPADLSTGDKQMGGIAFDFVGTGMVVAPGE